MTALPKILIVLVLWLIYCFALFRGCSDSLCLGCQVGQEAGAVVPPGDDSAALASRRYDIDFQWSNPRPFTNEGFEDRKESIVSGMKDNNTLEITGLYFEEEEAPEGYDNMGFARAAEVSRLFSGEIPGERIVTKARVIDERPGVREGYFEGVLFEWQQPEEAVAETVEELDDRVNIRFGYNSTEREYNPEVDAFLKRMAENLKKTGRKVRITGHTDNSGEEDYNMELGRRRARQIYDILIRDGVPAAQIEMDSRGESQPIASNDSEQGRHENRRVEVRIQKEGN